jgi:nicotinamidase-related amidase
MPGTWQCYYEKWKDATLERLDPHWLDLMPPLARLVPPAAVIDKSRYSAFSESGLLHELIKRRVDALIVTGSETDVCVLATVLGAVDRGIRVILVRDAVCSSSDEGHEAMLRICHDRFSEQIETADAQEVLSVWTDAGTNVAAGALLRKTGSQA